MPEQPPLSEPPLAEELSGVFAGLSGLLLSRQTVHEAMQLVTTLAAQTVPGSFGSGVTLLDERGRRSTAAATDARVERADAVQYELGAGPCLTAWGQRRPVRVDDVAVDRRWPEWAAVVGPLGLRSSLSVPLVAGDSALGAIKVYSLDAGVYDAAAEQRLTLFAGQAAVLLANMQSDETVRRLSDQLRDALGSRDVIAQAKGVVMAQEDLDGETAFAVLVARAQRERRPLRDTAQDLLDALPRRRR